jgi:hypothetical protein
VLEPLQLDNGHLGVRGFAGVDESTPARASSNAVGPTQTSATSPATGTPGEPKHRTDWDDFNTGRACLSIMPDLCSSIPQRLLVSAPALSRSQIALRRGDKVPTSSDVLEQARNVILCKIGLDN